MTTKFPIVGIGASAGGLEAFSQLLAALEVTSGMAFVLMQHLDPDHESLLRDLLARSTTMPVVEITDGVVVAPNHVYVMPPNRLLTFEDGRLKLSVRGPRGTEGHFPIDDFLRSLARGQKDGAIGVILSGTGGDGALGLQAILDEGGVTFAQDPATAKFEGMPSAAVAIGVDFVRAPVAIAVELANIARSIAGAVGASSAAPEESSADHIAREADLKAILQLLHTAKGMNFSNYKAPTIERRILRRMMLHKVNKPGEYVELLQGNPTELDCLYEEILIKVTCFFRVPESFEALREHVFPALMKGRAPSDPIRIWAPGCATGEEPYSLAMCLLEFLEESSTTAKIEIFATDVSEVALAKARLGLYGDKITENVSPARLSRFFTREPNGYRIGARVRECCIFAKQNVAHDPPFSKLDLISCRNLLIYLTPSTQRRVLVAFHFALRSSGFLSLGNSESIGVVTDLFDVVDSSSKIFSKNPVSRTATAPSFSLEPHDRGGDETAHPGPRRSELTRRLDVKSQADRVIQASYVPPGVVVDERSEVVQVRGDTSPFLMVPPGDVTSNLLKMCRPGLLVDLRTCLQEAAIRGTSIARDGWVKTAGADAVSVVLHVYPFTDAATSLRYFVVLFAPGPMATPHSLEHTDSSLADVLRLERELAETKEYLNEIIEQEQATNEELKSASEEILSANEELQSTSEEMATAKEETQATNEELITVNDELQSRNTELDRIGSDLTNLFGSVQIPIIMLSETLAVRHFTPSAEKALGLVPADRGRPLAEISARLSIGGLETLAAEVIESLNTRDQEVQDRDGRWYSLRIKPYRTTSNRIEGAVIALVDIDSLKRGFDQLKEAYDYADAIVQTTPMPLVVLDEALCVVMANQAFYKHFGVSKIETAGAKIYALGSGQWNIPRLRELLEEVLPKNQLIDSYMVDHEFPTLGRRTMQLSARRLIQPGDRATRILLAINDMTAEKQVEERVNAAKEAAETANQAKSDFLANMSHEIRTPLGAILGFAELLADPTQPKADALHGVTRIRKNVEHLTELIDEILDIAKIEAGKLEVDCVKFALLPELAETFALLQTRATAKGLTFDVAFRGPVPEFVRACPKRLRQILTNLGGNAIKFTSEGGVVVTVELLPSTSSPSRNLLQLAVTDTGCGLSPEQQLRLFIPFNQADSSVTRKFGGTGLGLTLARRLAAALGGDVVLTESAPGKGSTFTATIDTGSLAGVAMVDGLTKDGLSRREEGVSDWFRANTRLAGLSVLLVEDSPDIQALMASFLRASGATVEVAVNGAEAIQKAGAGAFDVVLMDIQMPVLDGYEATKRLKAGGFGPPIVALTAHAMKGERERCFAAGCADYISKPVKPNDLIAVVEQLGKKKSSALEPPLISLLADDPFVGPLLPTFLGNLPRRRRDIKRAEGFADWQTVARVAHDVAGAAGSYGFPELGDVARNVEAAARASRRTESLVRSLAAFDRLCERVTRAAPTFME